MLQSLSIRNFILINELDLEFESGLCVITGETGAGKSILLKALLFCLNNQIIDRPIKAGSDSCAVTSIFTLNDKIKDCLSEKQIDYDDQLVIKRVQTLDNRKKFLINDQVVTAKTVAEIADHLFELHGQNNHTTLLNAASHIDMLDEYGELNDLRNLVAKKYTELQHIKLQLKERANKQQTTEKEIEYLQFITTELLDANIQPQEEEELAELRRNLQNRDKELQLLNDLMSELATPAVAQVLNRAIRILSRFHQQDEKIIILTKLLDYVCTNLDEANEQVQNMLNLASINDHNLDEIEERLFMIRRLARKHGVLSDDLPQFLNDSILKLSELQKQIDNIEKLEIMLATAEKDYYDIARKLSLERAEVAKNLEQAIHAELSLLQMSKVKFNVECVERGTSNPTAKGIDDIRFMASTNPGTPPSPIDKIASGGELSRFMLALKTILVSKEHTQLVIFDEIDTGVSGSVADSIGERLKNLSQITQILVITHQPQVAAKADHHFLVSKIQSEHSTEVSVTNLVTEQRTQALAKMIAGKNITNNSLRAAADLYL